MDKIYDQTKTEEKWYKFWEDSGFFRPEVNPDGKPYTIILPPPNANADLHFGHAMMSIEDILIRFKRMQGYSTLWLPGSDHAGIETQVVFEKHLAKEGKSRFDYDRETLYKMIFEFVQKNKGSMEHQLRRLGFSVDWSREKFTLDPDIINLVYQTFKKMFDEGLVYRANRLVNYCTKMGTGFSDLEVLYIERKDKLYFIRYPFRDGSGSVTIATTRPETLFGDTAVAVNPEDPRYAGIIGRTISLPLTDRHIKIIADKNIETEFGTGAVKITPAHDPLDFTIGERNGLESITVIGFDGKLNEHAGKFASLPVEVARSNVVAELEALGLIEKIEDYTHRVGTCYKCGKVLEPLLMEQWFLNVQELKQKAAEAVKKGEIKIHPSNFEVHYFQWLENLKDWNISRQPVWGIRIPAWNCTDCKKWTVTEGKIPSNCSHCNSTELTQDTDTFDTWFSSGQWPVVTLKAGKQGDFEKFYPTSVMETGYDILKAWVSRMVMLGIYITGEVPFKDVVLHGLVRDPLGQKMSKSKGNVVSPMEVVDQYGADAARMALVYGTALGHDQNLSHPKLQAMRNFTNKLWNIGRFIMDFKPEGVEGLGSEEIPAPSHPDDKKIIEDLGELSKKVTQALDQYRFHDGADLLYEFIWHNFADKYVEKAKERREESQEILEYVFRASLELLHPYMPFITEELWQKLPHQGNSIMIARWPGSR
jgi:valyl-tRNA synthetase